MIGSTVSHYRILERLGGGGMGVVYKALDLKLDRFVALKFLSAHRSTTDEYKRRFAREARAASALDHPNIAAVYDIDETPDGRLFIAMALCEGETVKRRLERGPLAVDEAVDIAVQVAAGLAQAHARGIVHRDVKPGNVIVAPDGQVKLVDFGIAKLADQSRITRAGTAVGTAAYMAPEQFRDEAIDARVDVWALGVLIYEMTTGRLPFDDRDEKELINRILQEETERLTNLRDDIPEALDRIVRKALAKKPAERYLQMEEMRADLARVAGASDSWAQMDPTVVEVPGRPSSSVHPTSETSITSLIGKTIARYRILEHLGGGGMGVIYKAEDTQLNRIVALKFLPPELVRDPDAKARFLQEARSASSLEHPNICTIHEIGEAEDGRLYIVMPCYDGETLRRKIERGPMAVEEATDIGQQIARGLFKAHRAGIVHRDIKPANLIVTSDGVVKILDFGLAKLAGSVALTRTGSSLGTPAYMSPEQARGEAVDHRADLWSLGVVLYEMLAGRRPFRGEHEQAVLYAILHEEPQPLSQVRIDVPADLQRIVDGLLKKDQAERFPSVDGPLMALGALRNDPMTATLRLELDKAARGDRRRSRLWAAALALALAALAFAVLWALRSGGSAAEPLSGKIEQLTEQKGRETFPSLSPDGSYFAYTRWNGDNSDIFLQRVGGGNPQNLTEKCPLPDTQPAFSPDGKQIVYRSECDGGGLFLMGATGESPHKLTDFGFNPSWSPDGKEIVAAEEGVETPSVRRSDSRLWRIDVATAAKRLVSGDDAVQPSWSPRNLRIAYWGLPKGSSKRVVWTVGLDGKDPVAVTADDSSVNWNPVWSPDGSYLYFASDRSGIMNLWRVPIDEASGRVRGAPQAVTSGQQAAELMSLSRDGRHIAYASNDNRANIERLAFDPNGLRASGPPAPVTQGARGVQSLAVSPDGKWIAFHSTVQQEDVFVIGADGSNQRQLTNDRPNDRHPQFSPDGLRLVFYSDRSGHYEAWAVPVQGGPLEQLTRTTGDSVTFPIWARDGRSIVATHGAENAGRFDLALPVERRRFVPLPVRGNEPLRLSPSSWSPDGALLGGETVVRGAGGSAAGIGTYSLATAEYTRLTTSGKTPAWLSDSRTLLYTDDGRIMAVDAVSRRIQTVLEPGPNADFTGVVPSPDGRVLYALRATHEGDIWLLTLR